MSSYITYCGPNGQCPQLYHCTIANLCHHTLIPPTVGTLVSSFLIAFIAGISTLGGLGGGGPMVSILIVGFNYGPKISTIIVYALILGSTLGNVVSQGTTQVNSKPLIRYRYCFVSIPIMFAGSLVGVMINKLFPSLFVCVIIVATTISSLKKIYQKFWQSYQNETLENEQRLQGIMPERKLDIRRINMFNNPQNMFIFKRLILLVTVFFFLQLIRGSEKFHSIVGIKACSLTYWFFQSCMFLTVFIFSQWNMKNLKVWQYNDSMILVEKPLTDTFPVQSKIKEIIKGSLLGGLYSGFGLGGGLFLVPMFKSLGLNPLQATASTTFNIFITAIINTIQALFMGALNFDQLIYFLLFSAGGSFLVSKIISNQLQIRNRLSIVQLLLFLLLILSSINIPFGFIKKYIETGYDTNLLIGFGNIC